MRAERRSRRDAVADRGEIARAAAVEAEARERAQEVGRARQFAPQRLARRRRLDQKIERAEPFVDRGGIGQRAREPLGEEPRAGRRHGEIDRRQERALARAAQGSGELEIGAGGGVDFEACAARAPGRGREGRARLELGALDVGQRQRGRRDLGAGEGAEAVERLDPIEF